MLSSGLLVVHDTSRSSQDNITESSSRQQVVSPSLNILNLDVKSWGNDTTLVQSTSQSNNNLTRSVVINVFKLTNVALMLVTLPHEQRKVSVEIRMSRKSKR
ncbi:40s ribosomal protein s22 [Candidozyma auris]|nr:40s ribosomal protein s22 [[Candida] auris]